MNRAYARALGYRLSFFATLPIAAASYSYARKSIMSLAGPLARKWLIRKMIEEATNMKMSMQCRFRRIGAFLLSLEKEVDGIFVLYLLRLGMIREWWNAGCVGGRNPGWPRL